MKRSSSLALTGLMAGSALTVGACGPAAQWDQASVQREPVPAVAYPSVQACVDAGEIPAAQCQTAYDAAQKDDQAHAPRFNERASCEDTYGVGNCVPRSANGGGSFFTPLLAGFVIGRMLDGGGYRGTGLYRGPDGYSTGFGGGLSRDSRTGGMVIDRNAVDPPSSVRQAPPRMQTRSAVISRGGFGGGGRYYGG